MCWIDCLRWICDLDDHDDLGNIFLLHARRMMTTDNVDNLDDNDDDDDAKDN